MVKHIVLFKLTSYSDEEDKEFQLGQMKEIFSVLPAKLNFIVDFKTGINFTIAGHAWDFAIDSVFTGKDDLLRYQQSEEHLDAVRKASSISKIKAVVDYEYQMPRND
jgi:ADP-dependent phosphofructokinase/glucokinase